MLVLTIITNVLTAGIPLAILTYCFFSYRSISKIKIIPDNYTENLKGNISIPEMVGEIESVDHKIYSIYKIIFSAAHAYLYQQYTYMLIYVSIFACLLVLLITISNNIFNGIFTAIAFISGSLASILAGFIGMRVAVFTNARTTIMAKKSLQDAFNIAIKAGIIIGFSLCSIGILMLYTTIKLFSLYYSNSADQNVIVVLYVSLAGFAFGGSSIALFCRVGGGIFTKAADVGADLSGKVESSIPEDDARNPAVIADNVGDNVGDIAGMGSDLFGSFCESTCACLIIISESSDLWKDPNALLFPLLISAVALAGSFISTLISIKLFPTRMSYQVETALKRIILFSTIFSLIFMFVLTIVYLPSSFNIARPGEPDYIIKNWYCYISLAIGLLNGLIIGQITEYYTSYRYKPVREVAQSTDTGAATVIITGIALGYESTILTIITIAVSAFISYRLTGIIGIALSAIGILLTLSSSVAIDAFGPICDNAGGIAEMSGSDESVRELTDTLDSAGNTTAAVGKGVAINSAIFVSLALIISFADIRKIIVINLFDPSTFAGLLYGSMLPFWFCGMTMKSVSIAAAEVIKFVRFSFKNNPGILNGTVKPDYNKCTVIVADAALKEMIIPGLLVILNPLFFGYIFGNKTLIGMLIGVLITGAPLAIASVNSGGAWDNGKKYIEADKLGENKGKNSENHKAAVIGDTVGDPLKDTSGPSLNILIKLIAVICLVFSRVFPTTGYAESLFAYVF